MIIWLRLWVQHRGSSLGARIDRVNLTLSPGTTTRMRRPGDYQCHLSIKVTAIYFLFIEVSVLHKSDSWPPGLSEKVSDQGQEAASAQLSSQWKILWASSAPQARLKVNVRKKLDIGKHANYFYRVQDSPEMTNVMVMMLMNLIKYTTHRRFMLICYEKIKDLFLANRFPSIHELEKKSVRLTHHSALI